MVRRGTFSRDTDAVQHSRYTGLHYKPHATQGASTFIHMNMFYHFGRLIWHFAGVLRNIFVFQYKQRSENPILYIINARKPHILFGVSQAREDLRVKTAAEFPTITLLLEFLHVMIYESFVVKNDSTFSPLNLLLLSFESFIETANFTIKFLIIYSGRYPLVEDFDIKVALSSKVIAC